MKNSFSVLVLSALLIFPYSALAAPPQAAWQLEPSYASACAQWTEQEGQATVLAPQYSRSKFLSTFNGGVHTVYVSEVIDACPLLPSPAQLEPHFSEGIQVLIGVNNPPNFRLGPNPNSRQSLVDNHLPIVVTKWIDKSNRVACEETSFAHLLRDDNTVRAGDENSAAFLHLVLSNLTTETQPVHLWLSVNGSANSQSRALQPFAYQQLLQLDENRLTTEDSRWRLAWRAPENSTAEANLQTIIPTPAQWIEGYPQNPLRSQPIKAFDKNTYSAWEPTTGSLTKPAGLGFDFNARIWINQLSVQWLNTPPALGAIRVEVKVDDIWQPVIYTIQGKSLAELADHPEIQTQLGPSWTLDLYPVRADAIRLMIDRMPDPASHPAVAEVNVQYTGQYDPANRRGNWIRTEGGSLLLNSLHFTFDLPPSAKRTLEVAVPFLPGSQAEWAWYQKQNFTKLQTAVADEWVKQMAQGAQFELPEPAVQHVFDANIPHMLTIPDLDPTCGDLISKTNVGWYEAVWATMSAEQIVALDERGFHHEAERWLEPFLKWQGTMMPPGDYDDSKGYLAAPDRYTWVKWVNTHGYLLWALAQHYRLSGDRAWLDRALPHILAACDWIEHSRAKTRAPGKDGKLPPHAGLMPAGKSGDGNPDCYDSFTDAFTYQGLAAASALLTEIGHPRASEISAQRDDYRAAIDRAWRWGAAQMPPLQLKSGQKIPFVPRDVYNVFKFANGKIGENIWLEGGPLNFIDAGVFNANSDITGWMLQLAEDYCLKKGLSPGQPGFIPQASAYLGRDQIDRFLDCYYNLIAEGADRQIFTFAEYHGGIQPFPQTDAAHSRLVRRMLIHETTNSLELLPAIPRAWLLPGKQLSIKKAPTDFGDIDLIVDPRDGGNQINITIDPPQRHPVPIRLRIRHPDAKPLREVLIDGKPSTDFKQDWINLAAASAPLKIEAHF